MMDAFDAKRETARSIEERRLFGIAQFERLHQDVVDAVLAEIKKSINKGVFSAHVVVNDSNLTYSLIQYLGYLGYKVTDGSLDPRRDLNGTLSHRVNFSWN